MIQDIWRVIISRKSCAGKSLADWPLIEKALNRFNVLYSEVITNHKYHAIELARQAVLDGYRKLLVVGGDGALHEVLNGVFQQQEVPTDEVTFAIIPVGSGNDWARLHNISHDYEEAVELISRGESAVRYQDVACVQTMMDGSPYKRYMVNIGGLGFDAYVCHQFDVAKSRGHAGDRQYFKCLVRGFFFYKSLSFTVTVDDSLFFKGHALSVALGIGKYCGGGMRQTPEAEFDDGLIDMTVIRKMPKIKFLTEVKRLFDGTIFQCRQAMHTRGRHIEIAASPYSFMEADGETIGVTPVTIDVIRHAIKVVSNYVG